MDRYTRKNKSGYFLDAFLRVSGECDKLNGAVNRLGEYEDTGLTPEEIMDGRMLTGWIPVTEKLPEHEDKYWCTFSDGTTGTCLFMIWRNGGAFNISGCATRIDPNLSVIAWMPLLPAYQPPTLEASGRYADNDILMPAT